MPGLFDMGDLNLDTVMGSADPTMGESTLDKLLRMERERAARGPTPPVPAQGLDPTGSTPIVPQPPTGMPPVQGFGQDSRVPAQGLDLGGSTGLPGSASMLTQNMPPAQAMDVPDSIAQVAAARGIPPPKMDLPSWAQTDPTVGAALTGQNPEMAGGIPLPRPRPIGGGADISAQSRGGAPGAPLDITSAAQQAGAGTPPAADVKKAADLATALRGVTAPKPPELQKISSPSPPRAGGTIKGGDLMAILQMLNAGPGPGGGLKLPSTLGQALGGR